MKDIDVRLSRLAATQHWLITRGQAMHLGLTSHQIHLRAQNGALVRRHKGVFAVGGAPRTFEHDVLAACLAANGVASHRSAAALWRLRGFEPSAIDITVAERRPPKLAAVRTHGTDWLERRDLARVGIIPVTRVGRTLLDVGAIAPELVPGAVEDALYRGLESMDSLRRLLERLGERGRSGTAAVRRALDEHNPGEAPTESVLEDDFAALLRRYRVLGLVRQHRLTFPDGREIRLDFADPDVKLDIELDSRRWHSGPTDFQRDRWRDNLLAAYGWTVLRFTWRDVRTRGAEVVHEVTRLRLRLAG